MGPLGTLVFFFGEPSGLLLDAFRVHYEKCVKEYTEPMEIRDSLIMDDGITSKAQPLDVLINKVSKDYFRNLF